MSAAPSAGAVAELVRLPAVLSVPGDVWVGAATSGQAADIRRTAGLTAASSCLYLAGMALNDYADRDVDAVERPQRPIPSGRVSPQYALGLATGLTVGGVGLAVLADGARALKVAAPLAGAVWAYDLALKQTPAGVTGMSACRALDVLMGAGAHGVSGAAAAAAVVGTHAAATTSLSRTEVEGGAPGTARAALVATGAIAAVASALAFRRSASPARRLTALGLLGAYASTVGAAQADAVRDPSPARVQGAVGAGVIGTMPLQAGILAGTNGLLPAAGIASLWPLARALARRRSVT